MSTAVIVINLSSENMEMKLFLKLKDGKFSSGRAQLYGCELVPTHSSPLVTAERMDQRSSGVTSDNAVSSTTSTNLSLTLPQQQLRELGIKSKKVRKGVHKKRDNLVRRSKRHMKTKDMEYLDIILTIPKENVEYAEI